MLRRSFVFIVISFCFGFLTIDAAGLYGPSSDVIPLTEKNFASVLNDNHVWLVEFYAPWCGHCKNLAPEWEKAATNLKGIVRVGAVNCDDEPSLAQKYGIRGFPTIKLFSAESRPNPSKPTERLKVPEDYNGARSAASIATFALSKLPSHVVTVTTASYEKFISHTTETEAIPRVLLFTSKPKTADLYKALSADFLGRLVLGEAQQKEAELVQRFGVGSTFPTLYVVLPGKEDAPIKYDGKLTHEALFKFLSQYALPNPSPSTASSSSSSSSSPSPSPAQQDDGVFEQDAVIEFTSQAEFDAYCVESKRLCAVAFLRPLEATPAEATEDERAAFEADRKEHANYVQTLEKLLAKEKDKATGGKLRGNYVFGYVDLAAGSQQEEFARAVEVFSSDLPALSVVSPARKWYSPYRGAFEESAMREFLEGLLQGRKRTIPLRASLPPFEASPSSSSSSSSEGSTTKDEL